MNALQVVPDIPLAKDSDVRFVLEVGSAVLEIHARSLAGGGVQVARLQSTDDHVALMARLEEAEARAARAEAARNELAEKLSEAQASFREWARDRALDHPAHETALRELERGQPAAVPVAPAQAPAATAEVPQHVPVQPEVTEAAAGQDELPASVAAAVRGGRVNAFGGWEHQGLALREKMERVEGRRRDRDVRLDVGR